METPQGRVSKFPNCGEWQWAAPSISFRREELSRGGHSVGGEPEVGSLTGALEQCATGWRVGTGIALEVVSKLKIFDSCLGAPRPLRVMSVNVHVYSVGRPGLDPGTLGLKEVFEGLLTGSPVVSVVCFHENVSPLVTLVSWCRRKMRPEMRPVGTGQ